MSITSANAIITISVPGVFNVAQQLQGFAADDIYDIDSIESAETMMGVDGLLSGGFVFQPIKQNFALMADSASILVFENWFLAQQQIKDVFTANGTTVFPSLGREYTMTKGFLTNYKPSPDVKKLLQPRKFTLTWQSVTPSNS